MVKGEAKLRDIFENTKYYLVKTLHNVTFLGGSMRGEPKSDIDLYVIATIKRLRTERKISQAALAVKLDVSDAFIGQIESPKGKSKYNLEQLNKLAQIFGCSPRDFLPETPIISK